ncbi:MAG: hypothetical protein U0269_30345 [Polyangiales bacterium]
MTARLARTDVEEPQRANAALVLDAAVRDRGVERPNASVNGGLVHHRAFEERTSRRPNAMQFTFPELHRFRHPLTKRSVSAWPVDLAPNPDDRATERAAIAPR